jgi:hypothetical protein
MPKEGPIFEFKITAAFRREVEERTRRYSRSRRFLNRVADTLEGKDNFHPRITAQRIGVLLEPGTERYWPLVKKICDAVPGIRGNNVGEFGEAYGIRRSASSV